MPELHVSKKTISKLFSEMQNRKFIIPDYQRPYKWTIEKCETLWNDIENFTETEARTGSDYFLGTIVSYIDENKNQEIIDGQQRITSFFLMLRAFYRKLENMNEDEDVIGLKNQLAPCIWDINPISQKVSDKTKIHIESLVATEDDNETFHQILETGNSSNHAQDNYSVNYSFFKKQCDDYAERNPLQWKQLCVTILQKCIILPIECDTPETALTIFSTLNDRGLPLADSDIFKAQIYRNLDDEKKRKEFTTTWKELTRICKQANTSVDDIFRYYTHILRARNNDKTKEVGLRKFYGEDNYRRLKDENLMNEIMALANFWHCVNTGFSDEEDGYTLSIEARKFLQCLFCYPNEYWKYAISVFFLKNIERESFDIDFCAMLKKLIAFLFSKFIVTPTVNAIKDDVYAICISIQTNNELHVRFNFTEDLINQQIGKHSSSKLSRALLLLDCYLNKNQTTLIPDKFEIEHIFPKKWQDSNYNGWNIDDAQEYLDRFGNKIVFEKKLNTQAGNGYFGIKKQKYKLSKIACVQELSNYPKNDWVKDDIEIRETMFKSNLITFFKKQLTEPGEFPAENKISTAAPGYKTVEAPAKITATDNDVPLFECTKKGVYAIGKPLLSGGNKFVVYKGSLVVVEDADCLNNKDQKGIKELRNELIEKGILKKEGEFYCLTEKYCFNSPSEAIKTVLANSTSGPKEWQTEEGKTLKQYLDELEHRKRNKQ